LRVSPPAISADRYSRKALPRDTTVSAYSCWVCSESLPPWNAARPLHDRATATVGSSAPQLADDRAESSCGASRLAINIKRSRSPPRPERDDAHDDGAGRQPEQIGQHQRTFLVCRALRRTAVRMTLPSAWACRTSAATSLRRVPPAIARQDDDPYVVVYISRYLNRLSPSRSTKAAPASQPSTSAMPARGNVLMPSPPWRGPLPQLPGHPLRPGQEPPRAWRSR